jgi:plasmid stabilization system protein ParE
MRLHFSHAARRDLEGIIEYLAAESPSAAARVLQEIEDALEKLLAFPEMGHRRKDLTPRPLLFWQVFSYLVVYRVVGDRLEIARILHSARDVRQLLRP